MLSRAGLTCRAFQRAEHAQQRGRLQRRWRNWPSSVRTGEWPTLSDAAVKNARRADSPSLGCATGCEPWCGRTTSWSRQVRIEADTYFLQRAIGTSTRALNRSWTSASAHVRPGDDISAAERAHEHCDEFLLALLRRLKGLTDRFAPLDHQRGVRDGEEEEIGCFVQP